MESAFALLYRFLETLQNSTSVAVSICICHTFSCKVLRLNMIDGLVEGIKPPVPLLC
jgi:hypothetical protein